MQDSMGPRVKACDLIPRGLVLQWKPAEVPGFSQGKTLQFPSPEDRSNDFRECVTVEHE